jgi:hypothetical protein
VGRVWLRAGLLFGFERAGFLFGFERGRILRELPLPSLESLRVDYTGTQHTYSCGEGLV